MKEAEKKCFSFMRDVTYCEFGFVYANDLAEARRMLRDSWESPMTSGGDIVENYPLEVRVVLDVREDTGL